MTCPDWPLCKGSLVPLLMGGVVLEWTHRLVAALEGVVLIGALFTGWQARRKIGGLGPVLMALVIIFACQVTLGGLTVQLANRPDSVVWHWLMAMALLAGLANLAVLATVQPSTVPRVNRISFLLAITAVSCCVPMAAGAYVSASGAGLSCPSIPGCSDHFWDIGPLQALQMLHRLCGSLFLVLATAASLTAMVYSPRSRSFAALGLGLTILQIGLGIANVLFMLPTPLREAHAANAIATFLAYVLAAALAAIEAAHPRATTSKTRPTSFHSTPSRLGGALK